MSARETALQVLKNCRAEGGWANSMLKEQLARDRLDRRDAALATRLAYGVLQNRALLDHYLQQLLTGRLKDLRPVLRDILHLGLYQILFLDKIPESAAVNESVDLAKRYCKNQKNAAIPKAAWQPLQTKHTPRPCPSGWGLLRICQSFIRYSARFLSAFPDFPLRFPSVRLPWAQSPPPPQPDIYRSAACYPHTGPAADKARGSN